MVYLMTRKWSLNVNKQTNGRNERRNDGDGNGNIIMINGCRNDNKKMLALTKTTKYLECKVGINVFCVLVVKKE